MICKNCEHEFEGNFCSNCGQKATVQRINFRYLLEEVSGSLFKMNKGIFFTIKELFIRPGHSISGFLDGKRKWHVKPFAFVLLVSAVYVLFTHVVGKNTFLGEIMSGLSDGLSNNGADHLLTVKVLSWLINNHAYATLLLLPIFSLASYLAFFKSRYNYVEHIILNLYIAGQQIVIYLMVTLLLVKIENEDITETIPLILGIVYVFWAFAQLFESKSLFVKIALTALTFILYLFQITVLLYVSGYVEGFFAK